MSEQDYISQQEDSNLGIASPKKDRSSGSSSGADTETQPDTPVKTNPEGLGSPNPD